MLFIISIFFIKDFSIKSYAAGTPVSDLKIKEGVYQIRNLNSDLYMELNNGNTSNDTQIIQSVDNGSNNQKFYIKYISDNVYSIHPINILTKEFAIQGNSTANNANIVIYTDNDGNNQKFKIEKVGSNNYYTIKTLNSTNAKCLTVQGASPYNGAKIIQFDYNNGQNDHWYFELLTVPSNVYSIKSIGTNKYLAPYSINENSLLTFDADSKKPSSKDDRIRLFKIIYRPTNDDYIIRSMANNKFVIYPESSYE